MSETCDSACKLLYKDQHRKGEKAKGPEGPSVKVLSGPTESSPPELACHFGLKGHSDVSAPKGYPRQRYSKCRRILWYVINLKTK